MEDQIPPENRKRVVYCKQLGAKHILGKKQRLFHSIPQAHLMPLCFCWRLGACIKEGNGIPNTRNTKSQQTKATFSKLVNQTVKPSEPTKWPGLHFQKHCRKTYEPRAVKWEPLAFVTTFSIRISRGGGKWS